MPRINDMEREMNEQSGNSEQLPPDVGIGGDALPPLPIAFFDEFGRGADDRVQDYARAALAAAQPGAGSGGDVRARLEDWTSMFEGMSDAHIAHAVRMAERHYLSIGRDPLCCDVALCVLRDCELPAATAARQPVGHSTTVKLGAGLVKCDCGCGSDVCADCGQELGHLIPPAPAAVPVDVLRDAERYRWLREKAMLRGHDPAVLKDGPADCCEFYFGEELDAAIDSAMFATDPQLAAAKEQDDA